METNNVRGLFRPILYIFGGVSVALLFSKHLLAEKKIDYRILLVGNAVLFLATALSLYVCGRGLLNKSMQQFTNMLTQAMLMKMGVCIFAVVCWYFTNPESIGAIALLFCFVLYFLYTFTEVALLTRLTREKKNG